MKRFISVLLILLMCMTALSEAAEKLPEYLKCECGLKECVCFAQEGDTGYLIQTARSLLVEMGLLDKVHPQARFDESMKQAVIAFQKANGLNETGTLDDETLTALFSCEAELQAPDVKCLYVPVNGGQELHRSAICSGMQNARRISARNGMYLCNEGVTRLCLVCCSGLLNN